MNVEPKIPSAGQKCHEDSSNIQLFMSRSYEGAVIPVMDWCMLKMAIHNGDHGIGDEDSMTMINEDILIELSPPNEARYQRDVS